MAMQSGKCEVKAVRDLWHVLGAIDELPQGKVKRTTLLGEPVGFAKDAAGAIHIWQAQADLKDASAFTPRLASDPLPVKQAYGYLWTSLGTPPADLFPMPEYAEPDRRSMNAATFCVHVSAPRAVENFLDMGHFPFVHTNYLGVDVNVAARVAEQAKAGEVLVSEPTIEHLDRATLTCGRAKRLRAEGAPRDLRVCAVTR